MWRSNSIMNFFRVGLVLFTIGFLASCSSEEATGPNDAKLTTDRMTYDQRSQFLSIASGGGWHITLEYVGEEKDWCRVDRTSGSGNYIVTVSCDINTGEDNRQVDILVHFSGETITCSLTQLSQRNGPSDTGDYPKWMELPQIETGANQVFIKHFLPDVSSKRTFSIFYDEKDLIPLWVAYPVHKYYLGSADRSNAWQYDPAIPHSDQANLSGGMGNGYDRGHMCPSADRTINRAANEQTFYYTNMTPQINSFNADKWMYMESMVRKWAGSGVDTLYVVTGAVLQTQGGSESVKYVNNKNDGRKIAVPNYYYKVLLKITRSTDPVRYKAIGFWFRHAAASGNPTVSDAKTVREVEELTGLDFFPNLDREIQDRVETSFNPSEWEGLK